MAAIVKTPSGTWKALIRKTGWPTNIKTFRTKRDAQDWARRTGDEMVRGTYIVRATADRMTLEIALNRYLTEITPTKRPSSQEAERRRATILTKHLGKYSLAALTPEIVAKFRDERFAGEDRKNGDGKPIPRANDTVRLELALLGHLFTIAIKEWQLGLPSNPVLNIRRPAPGPGRERRLTQDEERRLFAAVDAYSNPVLRWIVRIALETGMRASEILTLRRKQVDLARRVVRLVETKNTTPRTVPLSRRAVELLREVLINPVQPIDSDLLFFGEPGHDGRRRPYEFNKVWMDLKRKIGLAHGGGRHGAPLGLVQEFVRRLVYQRRELFGLRLAGQKSNSSAVADAKRRGDLLVELQLDVLHVEECNQPFAPVAHFARDAGYTNYAWKSAQIHDSLVRVSGVDCSTIHLASWFGSRGRFPLPMVMEPSSQRQGC